MGISRRAAILGVGAAGLGAVAARQVATREGVPAVFVSPHQDDEVLSMGAAIREHVALGREVVVLIVGRGNKSVVRTRDMPALLGYTPTERAFGAVRDREFQWSCDTLGAARIVRPYDERIDEKGFTATNVASFIRRCVPQDADLNTLTKYAEYHPDHVACHDAVQSLFDSGWTTRAPRYYAHCARKAEIAGMGIQVVREGRTTPVTDTNHTPYRFTDLDQKRWGSDTGP